MTDENTFVMPPAWRRARHPRRDRPGVPKAPAVDETAAERVRSLVDGVRDGIEEVLALPDTAPDIAEAARAHLRGEPEAMGAAAVALVAAPLHGLPYSERERLFVDAWITDHGIAFAVAAFTELSGIQVENRIHRTSLQRVAGRPTPAVRNERIWTAVRHRRPDETWSGGRSDRKMLLRLRKALAAAPDDVYDDAGARLSRARRNTLQRLIAAYLVPTRELWVEDLCANPENAVIPLTGERSLLFCTLGAPHQLSALGLGLDYADRSLDVIASLIDGVGPEAVVPLLIDALDDPRIRADAHRTLLDVLAALPFDAAFQALVDRIDRAAASPAVLAAARRFPARALRLLARSDAPQAADLLAAHVRAHPALAEEIASDVPAIRTILDENVRFPPATELPLLLAEPPRTHRRAKQPVVIKDLPAPGIRAISWEPGERAAWTARVRYTGRWAEEVDLAEAAEKQIAGELESHVQPMLFTEGAEESVRPLLANWVPPAAAGPAWMQPIVARFEVEAADAALSIARGNPAAVATVLMPLCTDEIARAMADWLVRLKTAGETARAWFARHGSTAVPALLPDALGKPGAARNAAEAALRLVADLHGHAPIVEAARVHGDKAVAAIEDLPAADPLEKPPSKIPVVDWADPRALPQILVRDRAHVLPDEAARHVLTMLAMSRPQDVYAGVQVVRDLCDPVSLAEFGWELFRWWERCGAPSKEDWAFTQLVLTGDDETVRRLTPVIRAWPGEGGHAKAVTGLDVLAAIGTETALMHLHAIAQRVKFKGLRQRAQDKIEEVAAGLELSTEQLADRLVPDFGLDADGTLTLDYGPRRFVIGFDEKLKPTITDEAGKRRRSLPKPGAKDDPELAPAAQKRFAALKKDVRTVASDQVVRLERAMVARRRWPLAEFRGLLADHPLLRHPVHRLVWLAEDGPAFRVAEDGTFADADDDTIVLPEAARIGIAHPLDLPGTLAAWAEIFADYEILQPFPQLGRPVHALTDEEWKTGHFARFENLTVPTRAVLGLVNRGWERGDPQDAGVEGWISRRVADRRHVVIVLDPGIVVGAPDALGDQTLAEVCFAESPGCFWPRNDAGSFRIADLDPVLVSEVIADLTALTQETVR